MSPSLLAVGFQFAMENKDLQNDRRHADQRVLDAREKKERKKQVRSLLPGLQEASAERSSGRGKEEGATP
ncbi:hypothetical protein CTI12_AA626990 [Artemisia annua]|uniref:Uncharacterized protein n=1 Tax=Artemisia annua TaxID=35608 RepID=A0A2U1KAE1_ARTAN|nr:hypothetical protein CTI12_AA626990 [Artemisia annua]